MNRIIKALALGGALAIGVAVFVPAAGAGAQAVPAGCAPVVQSINLNAENVSFHPELDNVSFNEATSGISVNLELSDAGVNLAAQNVSFNIELGEVTSVNGRQCR